MLSVLSKLKSILWELKIEGEVRILLKNRHKTISEKKPLCIFFCKYNFQKCTLSYLCTKNDWKQFAVSLSKKFSKCFDILVERYRECMNEYHTIYIIHGTYIKYYTIHVILYIPYILAILYISKFRYTSMIKLEKEIILLIYLNLILVSGKLPLGKLPPPCPPPLRPRKLPPRNLPTRIFSAMKIPPYGSFPCEDHLQEIYPRENCPLWKFPQRISYIAHANYMITNPLSD